MRYKLSIGERLVLAGSVGVLTVVATVAGASASSSSTWNVYQYKSSGSGLSPTPAATSPPVASFNFAANVYTGLLATDSDAFTGDLTGKTVSASVSVTGMTAGATFVDQNGGGCTPDNQTVRLYFATGGAGSGTGFFTHFWWSNPVAVNLTNNGSGTMTVAIDPANWSDWNGHEGTYSPAVTAAFNTAITKVNTIGLSFGGGCFFENGVTTSDGSGTFTLSTFSVS